MMGYQTQMMPDNQPQLVPDSQPPPPYSIQNVMPTMPIAMPPPPAYMAPPSQLNFFDQQQPRPTQSLYDRRLHRNQCHAESEVKCEPGIKCEPEIKCESGIKHEPAIKCQQSAAAKSPSPDTGQPSRGKSMPVEIKSESPAMQSIEQAQTPISRSYEPRPRFPKREPADFNSTDSSLSAGVPCDKTFMPHVDIQAADGEFNPFATETPQNEGIFDPDLGFPSDPLMNMFLAGNYALSAPHSFDSSLDTSYAGTPAMKLEMDTKTHVGGLDSTVGGGVAPAQLESTAAKRSIRSNSRIPVRVKGPGASTASTSATGTPGIAPYQWNEWFEPGQWDDVVQ